MSISGFWFLFTIVSIIIFKVKIHSRIIVKYPDFSKRIKFVYIFLTAILCVSLFFLVTSDHTGALAVDASPLAELTSSQMENLEDAIIQLSHIEYLRVDISELQAERRYIISWTEYSERHGTTSYLRVTIVIYNVDNAASGAMDSIRRLYPRHRRIYKENEIEVIMLVPVRSSSYLLPNPNRFVRSDIRIDNTIISLSEVRSLRNADENLSSRFITMLVDFMQEGY